ncbi:hypothetical protein SAMN02799630_04806 [Paenibacillus sp. UNCCL117]|uniref:hypothetical protein n=1 Tax=unclassified Paenibacillus TaxID=185978 RepID=UPI000881E4CE|nr:MULTISPECIES: hypothetical protein [unclassified Paenibacillus]SDE14705.1 hypothetical protein SAMN04488602_12023 [Paenibacillus sp. cl123]SFW60676.1 hypothetical protein SAMN02799630_04806 [Paenibacillus sp. UNCCL117]
MKRRISLYVLLATVCFLLTGCLGAPRTETIILNDAEQQPGEETSPFTVQTIYSVLDGQGEGIYPIGWIDASALLAFTPEFPSWSRLDRVNEPYTARQKLSEVGVFTYPQNSLVSSPDRQNAAYISVSDRVLQLNLHSLGDSGNTLIETTKNKQILNARMSWSSNGRLLCYTIDNEDEKAIQLSVYDTIEGKSRRYTLPLAQQDELVTSVYVSNSGEAAVIVKRLGQESVLELGELRGNEFISQYRHPISNEDWVEWIHQDQISFVGADGILYAYDQRNDVLSVLLNDIGQFRLSSDRKFIVYTQEGDAVYAASIYGNNVLNMKQIYKGIVPYQMVWSPDNGKLLLVGSKPKEQAKSKPYTELKYQGLVIEFK